MMLVRSAGQSRSVNETRENAKYLPCVMIPDNIEWTTDVDDSVLDSEIVLLAIPNQFLRSFAQSNRSTMPVGVSLVLCAKSIELRSLQLPYDILKHELLGKNLKYVCVLSGPSFAKEIAAKNPTIVVVTSSETTIAEQVQMQMSAVEANFPVYTVTEAIGAEVAVL